LLASTKLLTWSVDCSQKGYEVIKDMRLNICFKLRSP
jgi:hypothetical protein